MGRSRGGFSTKIHAGCIDENTAVSLIISGGERNDMPYFDEVFNELPEEHNLKNGVMDRGYDSDTIRARLKENDINPVIPSRENRKILIEYDKEIYKFREKVERFFNKIKQFRRIATRYEKLGKTFIAFLHIAAVYIIL